MERYLKAPIKDVISRFPAVGEILDAFRIGCVPCSVGTCMLRDVVEIHDLSPEDEGEMMARIAAVVSPGRAVAPAPARRSRPAGPRAISYSPPLKGLVEEHKVIKRFVALIPAIAGRFDGWSDDDRRMLCEAVDFIRSFADRYHHAKEEEILFGYFDAGLEIVKAMREDHDRARGHVKALVDALEIRDGAGVAENLAGYGKVLAEHIRKEDEILYPWMDRNLSTRQVGEIFSKFSLVDGAFGERRGAYEAFVEGLEGQFTARGAEVGT